MTSKPATDAPGLDRRSLRESFERAASTYDGAAVLQREIADRLLARLDYVRLAPRAVLDAGCGTGYVTEGLARRYRGAALVALDLAEAMLARARARHAAPGLWGRIGRALGAGGAARGYLCADLERLPLADAGFDLVVSNLALHWCDPARAYREALRVLRPGGLYLFTTFGPDTLHELRAAWRAADDRPHVHGFYDMHDLGDLLIGAGFADPVMDVERMTVTYAQVRGVLRDLKRLGAHNVASARARGLTGKRHYARFVEAYESQRRDGNIPATYEVVYGHAWAMPQAPRVEAEGAAVVPVSRIARRRGRPGPS